MRRNQVSQIFNLSFGALTTLASKLPEDVVSVATFFLAPLWVNFIPLNTLLHDHFIQIKIPITDNKLKINFRFAFLVRISPFLAWKRFRWIAGVCGDDVLLVKVSISKAAVGFAFKNFLWVSLAPTVNSAVQICTHEQSDLWKLLFYHNLNRNICYILCFYGWTLPRNILVATEPKSYGIFEKKLYDQYHIQRHH